MARAHQRDEALLIERAQQGDTAAFDALVERHRTTLYRLMVRACHHPEDAEEVASEAFARAYEKLQQFEGRSEFVSWLGRIATNLCVRKRSRREVETESLDEASASEAASSPYATAREDSPEAEALRNEMRRIIRSCVARLPPAEQEVLRLRDIENQSGEVVAQQLGLSTPAMKSRLHRARRRLRELLDESLPR